MANFTKEIYERKAEWAANKQMDGAAEAIENGKLTEDQVKGIMEIAGIRHEIHCIDALRILENSNHDSEKFYNAPDRIAEIIEENDLPEFESEIDFVELPTSDDYYELYEDEYEDLNDWIENSGCINQISDAKEKFNGEIEAYLKKIDEESGTAFCPTGVTRIM